MIAVMKQCWTRRLSCCIHYSDARNMARDVHKCLLDVITSVGQRSSNEAEDYIKKLQQKGRYAQDVWS